MKKIPKHIERIYEAFENSADTYAELERVTGVSRTTIHTFLTGYYVNQTTILTAALMERYGLEITERED